MNTAGSVCHDPSKDSCNHHRTSIDSLDHTASFIGDDMSDSTLQSHTSNQRQETQSIAAKKAAVAVTIMEETVSDSLELISQSQTTNTFASIKMSLPKSTATGVNPPSATMPAAVEDVLPQPQSPIQQACDMLRVDSTHSNHFNGISTSSSVASLVNSLPLSATNSMVNDDDTQLFRPRSYSVDSNAPLPASVIINSDAITRSPSRPLPPLPPLPSDVTPGSLGTLNRAQSRPLPPNSRHSNRHGKHTRMNSCQHHQNTNSASMNIPNTNSTDFVTLYDEITKSAHSFDLHQMESIDDSERQPTSSAIASTATAVATEPLSTSIGTSPPPLPPRPRVIDTPLQLLPIENTMSAPEPTFTSMANIIVLSSSPPPLPPHPSSNISSIPYYNTTTTNNNVASTFPSRSPSTSNHSVITVSISESAIGPSMNNDRPLTRESRSETKLPRKPKYNNTPTVLPHPIDTRTPFQSTSSYLPPQTRRVTPAISKVETSRNIKIGDCRQHVTLVRPVIDENTELQQQPQSLMFSPSSPIIMSNQQSRQSPVLVPVPMNQRGNGTFVTKLPPEIHVHIARFLTLRELIVMCRVARQFSPHYDRNTHSPYDPDRPARIVKHIAMLLREFGETPLHYQANVVITPLIQHRNFTYANMALHAGKFGIPIGLVYWWAWQSGSPDLLAALLRARWQLTAESLRRIEWDYLPRNTNQQSTMMPPPFHGDDAEGSVLREAMASVGSAPGFLDASQSASGNRQHWRRSASFNRHPSREVAVTIPKRAASLFVTGLPTTSMNDNHSDPALITQQQQQQQQPINQPINHELFASSQNNGWLHEAIRLRDQFWYSCFTSDAPYLIDAVLRDPWAFLVAFPPADAVERARIQLRSLISSSNLNLLLELLEKRNLCSVSHGIYDWLLLVAAVCRSHSAMVRIRRTKRCTSHGWNQVLLRLTCYAVLATTSNSFLTSLTNEQVHSTISHVSTDHSQISQCELEKISKLYRETIIHGICTRKGIDKALIMLYVDRIDYDSANSTITVHSIPGSGDALTGGRARVDSVHLTGFGGMLLSTRLYSEDPAGRLLRHCCQRPDRSGMMITGTNNNFDTSDLYHDIINNISGGGTINGQDATINTSGVSLAHPVPQLLHFIIDGGRYPPEDADWCIQWLLRAEDLALLRRVLQNGIYSPQGLSWCFQHAHRYDDVNIYTEILRCTRPDADTLQRWRAHTSGRPKRKVARLLQEPDGGLRKLLPHLAREMNASKQQKANVTSQREVRHPLSPASPISPRSPLSPATPVSNNNDESSQVNNSKHNAVTGKIGEVTANVSKEAKRLSLRLGRMFF